MTSRKIRPALLLQAMLPLVFAVLIGAYYFALHLLRDQVVAALGKTGEVARVHIGFSTIEVDDLRIKASQPGWPAADELRAAQVRITPDLRSLLGGRIVISRIDVEDAELTVLRRRDGLKLLPALLAPPATAPAQTAASAPTTTTPQVRVGRISFTNSRVIFYDATIAARPRPVPLDQLELTVKDLALPALDTRSAVSLRARAGGKGSVKLDGWLIAANLDSDLRLKLADVPLKLLEPYLLRNELGEIRAGLLALDVHAKISQRRLEAPGQLTLSHIELGGLAGLTREAAAALARTHGLDADTQRPVDLAFTLQGNLDDARFSLNEAIYAQAGLALVKRVGIGGNGSHRGAQGGLGNMLRNLFGR